MRMEFLDKSFNLFLHRYLAPVSHCRMVEVPVFKTDAKIVWAPTRLTAPPNKGQ